MNDKSILDMPEGPERRAAEQLTGRYLVTVRKGAHLDVSSKLTGIGITAAKAATSESAVTHPLPTGSHLMLDHVGVAIVDAHPEQQSQFQTLAMSDNNVIAVEPERIVRAVGIGSGADRYLQGWRDATLALAGKLLDAGPNSAALDFSSVGASAATDLAT